MSASREWGLGRDVSVLRVRMGLECSEDNLRELMWYSNPDHGIARKVKIMKKQPFPWKALTLHGDPWYTHRTKDYTLVNIKGEQADCLLASPPPLPPQRQRGRCATARAWRQGMAAILALQTTSSTKLWASCQLLTTSFWDPGWFT